MPKLGEIRKGRELGYANNRAKFMWVACLDCFTPRWVMLKGNKPISTRCNDCKLTPTVKRKMSISHKRFYQKHPKLAQEAFLRMTTPEANVKRALALKGRHYSDEYRWRVSLRVKGENNPFYGKRHTLEAKKKMSTPRAEAFREIMRGVARNRPPMSEETRQKIREVLAQSEVKVKMSQKAKDRSWGAGNSHWLGGISFEPYSPEFNDRLKEQIRQRDNYQCLLCVTPENGRNHDVHHIDYNKKNSIPHNLITLCVPCHGKTSHHRKHWRLLFTQFMKERDNV